jgi:hypothetical protein
MKILSLFRGIGALFLAAIVVCLVAIIAVFGWVLSQVLGVFLIIGLVAFLIYDWWTDKG